MPGENEATIRRMLDALSARSAEAPAIVGEFWDADGDYYPVRKFPEARPCHGREAVSRFLTDYVEAWSYRYRIDDLIGVGDDRVLVCATLHAKGRGSELRLEGGLYHCIRRPRGRGVRPEDPL